MEEQVEQVKQETIKMGEKGRLEGPSGALFCEVIGAVLTVGVLGFWSGIGATLGAKRGPLRRPGVPTGPHD